MLAKDFNKGQKTRQQRQKTPPHQGQFKDTFSNFKRLRFAMSHVSSPSKMMIGSCFTTKSRWLNSGRSFIQIFRTVTCHWSQQILDSIHEQSGIIRLTVSKMGINFKSLTCIIKSIWNTVFVPAVWTKGIILLFYKGTRATWIVTTTPVLTSYPSLRRSLQVSC